jgi:hypothetical protein
MNGDALLGTLLIVGALLFLNILVIWSKRRIDAIAARGLESAREILRELDGD